MGKIHVYCGEGKGKTTASIGLAVRAAGAGYKVFFVQFLKASRTGELEILENIEQIEVIRCTKPLKFTFQMSEDELAECKALNECMFQEVLKKEFTEQTLLVLDESVGTMSKNLLDEATVLEFLKSNPKCEIVLTGRGPSQALIEIADYVTEMTKIKHPFDQELPARRGIEF